MTSFGSKIQRNQPGAPHAPGASGQAINGQSDSGVLGAVRDDIRQTLRMGWVDPAVEVAASEPVFFTAAWSAIRPNVGRSFLALAKAVRTEAEDQIQTAAAPSNLRKRLESELSEEELRRIEESARAIHLASAKAQIVVHALYLAARRERIPGTGREESPIRRGIPEWQRWMAFQPASADIREPLEEASRIFESPALPVPLRIFARWPAALIVLWESLREPAASTAWTEAARRLRRIVLSGLPTLPHPVELQWGVLKARGFTEEDRVRLAEGLERSDRGMAAQTLAAAFAWSAFGAPEIGSEG
jgi:hypothetical protein